MIYYTYDVAKPIWFSSLLISEKFAVTYFDEKDYTLEMFAWWNEKIFFA